MEKSPYSQPTCQLFINQSTTHGFPMPSSTPQKRPIGPRDYRKYSFFPRISTEFNRLPPEAISASVESFRSYL